MNLANGPRWFGPNENPSLKWKYATFPLGISWFCSLFMGRKGGSAPRLLLQQFTQVPNVFCFLGLEEQQVDSVYIRGPTAAAHTPQWWLNKSHKNSMWAFTNSTRRWWGFQCKWKDVSRHIVGPLWRKDTRMLWPHDVTHLECRMVKMPETGQLPCCSSG